MYNVSATMTLASSRIRVGMISGSTTNSASDGRVNTTLAVTVVSRRARRALHVPPERHRDRQPITTGSSDSRRCTTVSAQALSRWVSR